MTLEEFAGRYKVKVKKDSCDDPVIPGKLVKGAGGKKDRLEGHHHISEWDGTFFVYFNFPTKARWNSARRQLEAQGLKIKADGDMDGLMSFDPEDAAQVKTVLKLARIRVKRQLTDEQRKRLKVRFAKKGTNV